MPQSSRASAPASKRCLGAFVALLALAASGCASTPAAGDVADAYSYMAEYHVMGGDLPLAINQLELALSVPNITSQQRSKFVARLQEFREWLPKERRPRPTDQQQPPGNARSG
jgi:hypothetical protein